MPSMKLCRFTNQTMPSATSTSEIQTVDTVVAKFSSSASGDSATAAMTGSRKMIAAMQCAAKRARADRPRWSSIHPTAATIAIAIVSTTAAPIEVGGRIIAGTHAVASTATTMPMPPPRGVGAECERRRPGSSMSRRFFA